MHGFTVRSAAQHHSPLCSPVLKNLVCNGVDASISSGMAGCNKSVVVGLHFTSETTPASLLQQAHSVTAHGAEEKQRVLCHVCCADMG
jgi:hypothetical protein